MNCGPAGLGYIVFEKIEYDRSQAGRRRRAHRQVSYGRDLLMQMAKKAGLRSGDVLFFSAGKRPEAGRVAGAVRTRLGEELNLIAKDQLRALLDRRFPHV